MTNKDYLFKNERELAKSLIQVVAEENYDESSFYGIDLFLQTPDGEHFGYPNYTKTDMEEAIEETVKWLNAEKEK